MAQQVQLTDQRPLKATARRPTHPGHRRGVHCNPRSPRERPPAALAPRRRRMEMVAILGRPGGRPPAGSGTPAPRKGGSCDPRPPRRTTARRESVRFAAAGGVLRSSAAPGDDRQPRRISRTPAASRRLRSSAAPEDDRQRRPHGCPARRDRVAILGRPGGRPPAAVGSGPGPQSTCCDPRPPRRTTARLRSPMGDAPERRCDPRPPRRTTARWVGLLGVEGGYGLRSSAAPEDDRQPA